MKYTPEELDQALDGISVQVPEIFWQNSRSGRTGGFALILFDKFVIITVFYTNLQGLIIIYSFVVFSSLIYMFWFYKQFLSAYGYSKKTLIFRSLGVVFSYMFFSMMLGIVMTIMKIGK